MGTTTTTTPQSSGPPQPPESEWNSVPPPQAELPSWGSGGVATQQVTWGGRAGGEEEAEAPPPVESREAWEEKERAKAREMPLSAAQEKNMLTPTRTLSGPSEEVFFLRPGRFIVSLLLRRHLGEPPIYLCSRSMYIAVICMYRRDVSNDYM